MQLTKKFSDFLKLEEAQGNLPKLAGIGVAIASSFAFTMLAPKIANGACIHGDIYTNHSDTHDDYHCDLGKCGWEIYTNYSDSYIGCYQG